MPRPTNGVCPDVTIAEGFLDTLYAGATRGHLTLLRREDKNVKVSNFLDITSVTVDQAAARACKIAREFDVYFGVGLRAEKLEGGKRGDADSVVVIPGFWADADFNHAAHKEQHLPPDENGAMLVLSAGGIEPTMVVHTGHGLHGYYLFPQPLVIDEHNRARVKALSAKLHAIRHRVARQHGWKMDNTSDLARILRVAGTVNWKDEAEPKPVTFEVGGPRYDLDEIERRLLDSASPEVSVSFAGSDSFESFATAAETGRQDHAGAVATAATSEAIQPASCDGFVGFVPGVDSQNVNGGSHLSDRSPKEFPPAKIDLILRGCPWMRHCVDDAATLSEPEWFRMLSTVGRCEDGQKFAHEFSRPYPAYSPAETQRKLEHALTAAGPTTCEYVINNLNGHQYCSTCPNLGLVTAPIVLGNPAPQLTVNDDTWPEPKLLAPTLPRVAPFDVSLLPGCFRDHVADISELMQVPPDFPAAILIVAFSGAVGRRVEIHPKRLDHSFRIVPNLWGGIVGRPGFMKSPTIRRVLTPLRKLQAESLEAHKEAMQEYERALEAWEMRKVDWKKNAQKNYDGESVFEEEKPEKPACTRYMVNDATIPKLHEILAENPNGILYVRDELAGWFAMLDTKGRETDRPFVLEAWNGDGDFTIDRIGRGTIHVEHVCISVVGGIQPAKLQNYMRHAVGGGPEDDGLAQRLQFIVWPDPSPEWTNVDREPDERAAEAVQQAFRRVVERNGSESAITRFSPDAQELFDAWRAELELRLRKGGLKPALESHLAKYRKLMPALALLLHLAESDGQEVQLIHAQNAADLCDYLESHANRVYAAPRAADEQSAAALGERIKKGRLGIRFTARDVYMHKWSGLTTPDEAERALTILQEAGWVRAVDVAPGPQGGRRTVAYEVNPAVYRG